MKKLFIIFILIFSISNITWGENAKSSIFETANRLYSEENYSDAIKMYLRLYNEGYKIAPVMYNIGNCEARMGNLGRALKWYIRAKRISPRDPEIRANILYIKKTRMDKISLLSRNFLSRLVYKFNDYTTFEEKTVILTLFYLLFFMFSILSVLTNRYTHRLTHNVFLTLSIILLFFTVLIGLNTFNESNRLRNRKNAVIIVAKVDVMTAPIMSSKVSFTLHDGSEIEVVKVSNDWALIRLPDGLSGWMKKDSLERI